MINTLNIDLYRPEKIHYMNSLDYAKNLPKNIDSKIIIHCFWRVPREFSRKQLAVIKSIITTHQYKIEDVEINLWSNVDLSYSEYFKEVSNYVNLKIWNLQNELKGTILEDCDFLKSQEYIHDQSCYLEGDLFRLLVLKKYGGFYIDMDVLVLRDLSPLNNYEFLYQWGTSGFNSNEPDIKMNGAIMRLDRDSEASNEFLEILKNTPPIKDSFNWGTNMYSKITSDIWILPGIWFNSEWGFEETQHDPFRKVENYSLFDGAFAWHWHNRWDQEIEEGSKFQILESEINEKFSKIKKINEKNEII